jgi:hypothetical protein
MASAIGAFFGEGFRAERSRSPPHPSHGAPSGPRSTHWADIYIIWGRRLLLCVAMQFNPLVSRGTISINACNFSYGCVAAWISSGVVAHEEAGGLAEHRRVFYGLLSPLEPRSKHDHLRSVGYFSASGTAGNR